MKELDKFYTKREVAFSCILEIDNIESYTKIIEPSAGNGSFSSQISNCLAYDLAPEDDSIIKQDFFSLLIVKKSNEKILTIGNPPFGKKSKLAIDFFNHASLYSDTIAFIVPLQFRKWSVQSKLNSGFILSKDIDLPRDSFLDGGKKFSLGCCFQVWERKSSEIKYDKRIRCKPATKHTDFDLWQYNCTKEALKYFDKNVYNWDFAVQRQGYGDYSKKVYREQDLNPKIQWIFIKANNKEVLDKLLNIDYTLLSGKNIAIPGFGKADLIKEYENEYNREDSEGTL